MARINIEDSIYRDARFLLLVSKVGIDTALGSIVRAFTVAQKFWKNGLAPIPVDEWQKQMLNPALIDVGLAVLLEGGYYVAGSKEQFAWLVQKSEAGKQGGIKSGETRKKNQNEAKRSGAKRSEAASSGSKPPTPSLPLSPSLSSNSNSDSNSKNGKKAQRFIAHYCDLFKRHHNASAEILGKQAGIAKRIAKDLPDDKVELYLEAFFAMPDAWLKKTRHPLEVFESKINEIAVFAQTKEFTTSREARNNEDAAAVGGQLQRIREGAL